MKYLVEDRGLNLAGVQLALQLTNKLRALRERAQQVNQAGASAKSVPSDELAAQMALQFDQLLLLLGHVDEPQ